MPTSTDVTNLKINELTEAQYDTAVQQGVIGANELSVITDLDESIQVSTMPTASATELGNIYQFVGTTDANYTNGYFYKCVSDGQQPATYSWSNIQVQASSGGLPSQSGQNGKFLTTNGTDASWSNEIPSIVIKGSHNYTFDSFANHLRVRHIYNNIANELFVADKDGNVQYPKHGILGYNGNYLSKVVTQKIGRSDYATTDITIPSVAGSMAVQVATMPTANSTREGQIYQFTGATDSTYTNGHFYKCVSDGQNPATYSWTEVQLGGGGSSYTAGTGISISSNTISVDSSVAINNTSSLFDLAICDSASASGQSIALGYQSSSTNTGVSVGKSSRSNNGVGIGFGCQGTAQYAIAIGRSQVASAVGAIQIGSSAMGSATNSDANTFKVANANGNYEMMSADGTIPHARLVNAVSSTSVTIATTDWSSNTASVTVSGLTATSVVWVAPDNASQSAYTTAGVYASSQSADTLTFTCTQTPSASLTINVVFC